MKNKKFIYFLILILSVAAIVMYVKMPLYGNLNFNGLNSLFIEALKLFNAENLDFKLVGAAAVFFLPLIFWGLAALLALTNIANKRAKKFGIFMYSLLALASLAVYGFIDKMPGGGFFDYINLILLGSGRAAGFYAVFAAAAAVFILNLLYVPQKNTVEYRQTQSGNNYVKLKPKAKTNFINLLIVLLIVAAGYVLIFMPLIKTSDAHVEYVSLMEHQFNYFRENIASVSAELILSSLILLIPFLLLFAMFIKAFKNVAGKRAENALIIFLSMLAAAFFISIIFINKINLSLLSEYQALLDGSSADVGIIAVIAAVALIFVFSLFNVKGKDGAKQKQISENINASVARSRQLNPQKEAALPPKDIQVNYEIKKCTSCGRANSASAFYCNSCGSSLARCPMCGAKTAYNNQYCDVCGKKLR